MEPDNLDQEEDIQLAIARSVASFQADDIRRVAADAADARQSKKKAKPSLGGTTNATKGSTSVGGSSSASRNQSSAAGGGSARNTGTAAGARSGTTGLNEQAGDLTKAARHSDDKNKQAGCAAMDRFNKGPPGFKPKSKKDRQQPPE